jgi:H+/Cl- antiporter ClcA
VNEHATAPPSAIGLLVRAVVTGVLVALVFLGFEWVVNEGTDWLWDDVVHTNQDRWRVIPLAIVLSLAFALILRVLRQPRVGVVHTDPLAGGEDPPDATLSGLAVILVVGAASLLAGASLGPEASLVAASAALGTMFAGGRRSRQLFVLAAIGALLVVFLGSLVPVLLPLLMIYRQQKRLPIGAALVVIVTSLVAYGVLLLIKGKAEGYGDIPASTHLAVKDFFIALGLGICGFLVGAALKWAVDHASRRTAKIDQRWPWLVAAVLFGTGIGVLYLIGGQTVEFSGRQGTGMLVQDHAGDTALALAGLVVVKLLVTGWSLASGYRGGLVFPSIYAGTAMSLLAVALFSDLSGPGASIGAISGLIAAMTAPIPAIILVAALLPVKLMGLALAGVGGAVVAQRVAKRRA